MATNSTYAQFQRKISNQVDTLDVTFTFAQHMDSISFTVSLVIVHLVGWFATGSFLVLLMPNYDPDLLAALGLQS